MMKYSDFVLYGQLPPNKLTTLLFNRFQTLNRSPFYSNLNKNYYPIRQSNSAENGKYKIIFIHGSIHLRNNTRSDKKPALNELDVLSLLNNYGDNFLKKIKGPFLIIIFCKIDNSFELYTDQLHANPVYYYYQNSYLIVSSSLTEAINILRKEKFEVKPAIQTILEFSLYNYKLDNCSFIENIKETGSGEQIKFSNGRTSIKKLFDPMSDIDLSGAQYNINEGIALLRRVLKRNVSIYNHGPKNTAIAFTGGYDSRSIIACLENDLNDYQYFSYGRPENWDIKIPLEIAKKLGLNYKPFLFSNEFDMKFYKNAELAVLLGDGVGSFSHANYVYVYSNFFHDKTNVITGLFGSELIKRIAGANSAMNKNIIDLLTNSLIDETIKKQINNTLKDSILSRKTIKGYTESLFSSIMKNQFINNDLPQNKKVFLHYFSISVPKYFQKELKIQSPWINNHHPFYDIDFIEGLLKTPFPNVYNWKLKKSLSRNIIPHKLYGAIIDQKPELSKFISTHGFKPNQLNNWILYPSLISSYYKYKSQIKASSTQTFTTLINNSIAHYLPTTKLEKESIFYPMLCSREMDNQQFQKMFSLYYWFKANNIEV